MAILLGNEPETGVYPGLNGMVWSGSTWPRQVDGAQRVAEMAQARAGELEQRVGEQARLLEQQAGELREARDKLLEQAGELGELEALRKQVAQQQDLIARLSSQGRPRGQRPQGA